MNCEHKTTAKKLRFFKNAAYKSKDFRAPKWAFHIEEVCAACGKHLRFVPQTPELIQSLNGKLLISNFLNGRDDVNTIGE